MRKILLTLAAAFIGLSMGLAAAPASAANVKITPLGG